MGVLWEFVCHECKMRVDVHGVGSADWRREPIDNVRDWAASGDVPEYARRCHDKVAACLGSGHSCEVFSPETLWGEEPNGVYYGWGDYADKGKLYLDLRGYGWMGWD